MTKKHQTTVRARPLLERIEAYTPGEQPTDPSIVKLNTNEFPYEPSPEVAAALARCADNLGRYPEPRCARLREILGEYHDLSPENIFVGNGSDEVLRLLIGAYGGAGRMTACATPTYSLYRTLVQLTASESLHEFPLADGDKLTDEMCEAAWDIFILATPNPPLGTWFDEKQIAPLAHCGGLLVLDQTYIDFSTGVNEKALLDRHPNLAMTRTFSKAFGLANLRIGYAIAPPHIIQSLEKLADSYNVNGVAQVAAIAAIQSVDYYREKIKRICDDRAWLTKRLAERGFVVPKSHGNFIFARRKDAKAVFDYLREQNILARYFDRPGLRDGLRFSIGTRRQLELVIDAVDQYSG